MSGVELKEHGINMR